MANAANLVNFGGGGTLAIGDWTYSLGPLSSPAYLPLNDASVLYLTSSYVTLAAVIDNPYYSWTTTDIPSTLGATQYWSSVASDGTTTVAVAFGNTTAATSAMSSINLTTWATRTMPSAAYWSSVTYGGGTFVAVAQLTAAGASACTVAASSTNGTTWTSRTLPTATQWRCVIYGNSQFLAVAGPSNAAATSPDGITWTARTLPASRGWIALAYGAGLYVAINSDTATNSYATSPDGITWTARTPPYALGVAGRSIAFAAGTFVLVTGSGTLYTSADGLTWTLRATPGSLQFSDVSYGGGLFVVLGGGASADNRAITSADGKVWTLRTLPSSQAWLDAVYTGTAFFAMSQDATNGAAFSSVVASTGQFTLPVVTPVTGTQTYVKAT